LAEWVTAGRFKVWNIERKWRSEPLNHVVALYCSAGSTCSDNARQVTEQPVVFFGAPDLVNPSMHSGLMDLREAAEYLNISTRKLKDLCRDGRVTNSRPDYRTFRFFRTGPRSLGRNLSQACPVKVRENPETTLAYWTRIGRRF
jgi:hypothetical protein